MTTNTNTPINGVNDNFISYRSSHTTQNTHSNNTHSNNTNSSESDEKKSLYIKFMHSMKNNINI